MVNKIIYGFFVLCNLLLIYESHALNYTGSDRICFDDINGDSVCNSGSIFYDTNTDIVVRLYDAKFNGNAAEGIILIQKLFWLGVGMVLIFFVIQILRY